MENVTASFSRVKLLIILVFYTMTRHLSSPLPHNMNFGLDFEENWIQKIGTMKNVAASFSRAPVLVILLFCSMYGIYLNSSLITLFLVWVSK